MFYWLVSSDLLMIWTLWMISQKWFRIWLGAIRQQAITWVNVTPHPAPTVRTHTLNITSCYPSAISHSQRKLSLWGYWDLQGHWNWSCILIMISIAGADDISSRNIEIIDLTQNQVITGVSYPVISHYLNHWRPKTRTIKLSIHGYRCRITRGLWFG